jgi:hypothetical protein
MVAGPRSSSPASAMVVVDEPAHAVDAGVAA